MIHLQIYFINDGMKHGKIKVKIFMIILTFKGTLSIFFERRF